MNPRQRRGLLLMFLAVFVAIGVFVSVSSYVSGVNSKVGPMVTVYQAKKPLVAFTKLSVDNVEAVRVPERWVSQSTLLTSSDIDGRVIAVPMSAGSAVSEDLLVPPSDLSPDEREIAVNVNAVTGLAGRIRPGDRVDVYAVFSEVPGLANQARVLVRSVRVISVGGKQQVAASDDRSLKDVIPVTLALLPNDALGITYANAFAEEVRLVGLPAGSAQDRKGERDEYTAGQLGGKEVTKEAER
ncbi:MAG TPA: Flp pilus assembly protein CpaB [Actinomycetales bacterium]|jgi:pilus assembly protein CpaB